jgi:hypothetical protein
MEVSDRRSIQQPQLGEETLERIAATLSDLYFVLYEERPGDAHASLTGNVLAFVFEGGLSVSDEWLLRSGRHERLSEFRRSFFEVVDAELTEIVSGLASLPVTYSFYGFDPTTRSTHAIFVLDMTELHGAEQRQAVLNWSEQVRRNARRLREQHRATREVHQALREQMREKRAEVRAAAEQDGGEELGPRSDDP